MEENIQAIKETLQIGKSGLTQPLIEEIKLQLKKRKIIKIKIMKNAADKRDELIEKIIAHTDSQLVKRVGNTLVLKKVGKNL